MEQKILKKQKTTEIGYRSVIKSLITTYNEISRDKFKGQIKNT